MVSGAARRLTDRQRAVMERIDRRVPIKVIAQDLGVSETRINQHIRALKLFYDAGSLGELVEIYRATLAAEPGQTTLETCPDPAPDADLLKPFSQSAYTISQVNAAAESDELEDRNDPGRLILSDAMPLFEQAPWLRSGEPRVVPGVLDGEHAVLLRLGVIVGIATGILASVILVITAAMTLSAATDGKANYSWQTQAAAG
jgi:hypothetical protein